MGLGPILPGRIPGSLVASRLVENLRLGQQALATIQQQIATGQRFFRPSEDPAAAARSILLQRIIERKDQYAINVSVDKSFLDASEATLQGASDTINRAKSLLLNGTGNTISTAERDALAVEVQTLIQGLTHAANSKVRNRYLFGGSESQGLPFEVLAGGYVRYNGDQHSIDTLIDARFLLANNVSGADAFGATSEPFGLDLDPALTLQTRLSDLHGGDGLDLGEITVTVDNGGAVANTVNLAGASTIADVKTRIENAFAPGTLTVSIAPGPPQNGLRITAAAGTVQIDDPAGSHVAANLGIKSGPAATINGGDLDPALTLTTSLTALQGGAGVTLNDGLLFKNGSIERSVNVSAAQTVEDLLNIFRSEGLEIDARINDARNGLAVSTRLSGADFSIGENGGDDAENLGIRTFRSATLLKDLNFGAGVPVDLRDAQGNLLPALLEIQRRNGTTVQVDLKGLATVQQVIDKINTVDPGMLTASLNAIGNGFSIVDNDGSTGPLVVVENEVSTALGLNGSETGTNPAIPLVGRDVNPKEADGLFNVLLRLETALRNGNSRELARISPLLDAETGRLNLVRAELGTRQRLLEEVEDRLGDEDVRLKENLGNVLDVEMTQAITQLAQLTATIQANLTVASQTLNMSLLSFL